MCVNLRIPTTVSVATKRSASRLPQNKHASIAERRSGGERTKTTQPGSVREIVGLQQVPTRLSFRDIRE